VPTYVAFFRLAGRWDPEHEPLHARLQELHDVGTHYVRITWRGAEGARTWTVVPSPYEKHPGDGYKILETGEIRQKL
jgi:hypothetical protein